MKMGEILHPHTGEHILRRLYSNGKFYRFLIDFPSWLKGENQAPSFAKRFYGNYLLLCCLQILRGGSPLQSTQRTLFTSQTVEIEEKYAKSKFFEELLDDPAAAALCLLKDQNLETITVNTGRVVLKERGVEFALQHGSSSPSKSESSRVLFPP